VNRSHIDLTETGRVEVHRSGLNLSRATLAATIKYPWIRGQIPIGVERRKWGTYIGDPETLPQKAFEAAGLPSECINYNEDPTFEAQVMEWCDDVTYATHDALDFYQNGMLPLDRLLAFAPNGKASLHPDADVLRSDFLSAKPEYGEEVVSSALAFLVKNFLPITEPWTPKYSVKAVTQLGASRLISALIDGIGWVARGTGHLPTYDYGSGFPLLYRGDFVLHPKPEEHQAKKAAVDILKYLTHTRVHKHRNIMSQEQGQKRIIAALFQAHVDDPDLLPIDRTEELEIHKNTARAASDHVASLAEPNAIALFQRITGSNLGAVSDIV